MGRVHRFGIGAFLAAAVVVLMGPSSAWPSSPPLTVAQYRDRVKAICAVASREQSAAASGNLAQRLAFDLRVARTAYDALARLNPPPELRQLHAAMLADTRALLAETPALIRAAKEGETAFARVSAQERASNAKFAKKEAAVWVKLGVPSCNAS